MPPLETVRIVPSSEEQGNYVLINAEDFDKKKHKVYEGPDNPAPVVSSFKSNEELAAELAEVKAKLAALEGTPANEGGEGWGAPPEA